MTNAKLKELVLNTLTKKVREDAKIEITTIGNSVFACVRVPHINHVTNRTEYSLPDGIRFWGIEKPANIIVKLEKYLARRDFLCR